MANASKADIDTVEDNDPRWRWPKNAAVLTATGMSKRRLENLVRTGSARYVYDTTGDRHFDPEWVNEVSGVVEEIAVEADLTASVMADLRRALGDMVKSNNQEKRFQPSRLPA